MSEENANVKNAEIVSKANNTFATKFYHLLSNEDGNLLFSPLSAHILLAIIFQGAVSETANFLGQALGISSQFIAADGYQKVVESLNNLDDITLHTATSAFVSNKMVLKSKFSKVVSKLFLSSVESIDFLNKENAAKLINQWVEDKTNSKITNLFEPNDFDKDTRLILANAMYFQGKWKYAFKPDDTKLEPFFITRDNKIECQMMHVKQRFCCSVSEHLNARVLKIPYKNNNVNLIIILPNEINGIQDLDSKMIDVDLASLSKCTQLIEVNLSLPKFKIAADLDLKVIFSKMDLKIIFDQSKADFSLIAEGDEEIYVNKALQKAFIEVDEKGTEACVITYKKMLIKKCGRPLTIDFVVDHPFSFFLEAEIKGVSCILFYGKIIEPKY